MRAEAALKAALAEVSTIKVREIRYEPSTPGRESCMTVHMDLLGQRQTLSCEIHSDGEPQQLRSAFEAPRGGSAQQNAMSIIVAPYLSPEAQALCKENKTGFVDLEGNVRLALGEVFILKRTLPHQSQQHTAAAEWRPASKERAVVRSMSARRSAAQSLMA